MVQKAGDSVSVLRELMDISGSLLYSSAHCSPSQIKASIPQQGLFSMHCFHISALMSQMQCTSSKKVNRRQSKKEWRDFKEKTQILSWLRQVISSHSSADFFWDMAHCFYYRYIYTFYRGLCFLFERDLIWSSIGFCPEVRAELCFMKMMIKKKETNIIFLFSPNPAVSWRLGYCHWSHYNCLVPIVKLFFSKAYPAQQEPAAQQRKPKSATREKHQNK